VSDLGPMPDAETEPREPNPGGVDAMPQDEDNLPADLDPADNPALSESEEVKEAVSGGEDTETEATKNGKDVDPSEESPA
jgi:hypothetical protein